MAGSFDCDSIGKFLGVPSHNVRQALQANDIDIDADDCIPVEVFDKNRDKLQKFVDQQAKEYLDAKKERANMAEEKAKWLEKHNAKVAAEVAKTQEDSE